jgi:hypothetical protein
MYKLWIHFHCVAHAEIRPGVQALLFQVIAALAAEDADRSERLQHIMEAGSSSLEDSRLKAYHCEESTCAFTFEVTTFKNWLI